MIWCALDFLADGHIHFFYVRIPDFENRFLDKHFLSELRLFGTWKRDSIRK